MRKFLTSVSAGLIMTLAVSAQSFAQDSGKRYFSKESGAYAIDARKDQDANDHKGAIKKLKKGLKLKGLTPYERSAMEQMLGNSYYATGKEKDAIEAFEDALAAGGLRADEARSVQLNIAQINVKDENYEIGAQQLEAYFREGGTQKPTLVKLVLQAHMKSKNRQAAAPWAQVMLDRGYLKSRNDYDVALYLFDSPERRSSQIRVANQMAQLWPGDAALQTQVAGLKAKASREAAGPG